MGSSHLVLRAGQSHELAVELADQKLQSKMQQECVDTCDDTSASDDAQCVTDCMETYPRPKTTVRFTITAPGENGDTGGASLRPSEVETNAKGVAKTTLTTGTGEVAIDVEVEAAGAHPALFRVATTETEEKGKPQRGFAAVPRGPILIDGDKDFTTGNGVLGGDGSAGNPFQIKGHLITPGHKAACIEIRNTTSHYVISEVECRNTDYGIVLDNADNGLITNTLITDLSGLTGAAPDGKGGPAVGILLRDVDDLTVRQSVIAYLSGGAGAAGGTWGSPNGGKGGAVLGITGLNTSKVTIKQTELRQLSGGAGGLGSTPLQLTGQGGNGGDGGACSAIHSEGQASDLLLDHVTLVRMYGGAGGAGMPGTMGMGGGDGGHGGHGGETRVLHVTGTTKRLSVTDTGFRFVYGGAGGVGAMGAVSSFSGGDGGKGGDGGDAQAVWLLGDTTDLFLKDDTFQYVYGGAAAVGAVGAIWYGSSGASGQSGSARVVAGKGTLQNVTVEDSDVSFVYGGAGPAGSAGVLFGMAGASGGKGGDSVAFDFSGLDGGLFTGSELTWLFGGAGGAGAAGALKILYGSGGAGGDGGLGGHAYAMRFVQSDRVKVRTNSIKRVFGGAGAAGGWGGSARYYGGTGGDGGSGGSATAVRYHKTLNTDTSNNYFGSIYGAMGGAGALRGLGINIWSSSGGSGGDGGDGLGLHYLDCPTGSGSNDFGVISAGVAGLGTGAAGEAGREGRKQQD